VEITFVCCIESGALESYTVRMIESLRRWGGCYSMSQVIAVTPRFGSPLLRTTLNKFKELNVTYVRSTPKTGYSWFKFLNKPLALVVADSYINTDLVCWLDSDLLIVDEPTELGLNSEESFAGFPVEQKEMGTEGEGDPYEPVWQEFCHILDIDINTLPWVITAETHQKVRLYFNGGIFVYRRSSDFSKLYLEFCTKLLGSRIIGRSSDYNDGLKEMISIGFVVEKLGLKWKKLPYSHDYVMSSKTHNKWFKEKNLNEAKIVHFHDSMWPHFWPTFLECMNKTHPEVGKWLEAKGPVENKAHWQWRLLNRLLISLRKKQEHKYQKNCRAF